MKTGTYSIGFRLAVANVVKVAAGVSRYSVATTDPARVVSAAASAAPMLIDGSSQADDDFFTVAFGGALDDPAVADFTAGFRAGTYIAVPGGATLVENLVVGDEVTTGTGKIRAIRRILRRQPASEAGFHVAIRLTGSALADQIPAGDLWVAPEQALLVDGSLVAASDLVNGVSVVRIHDAEPAAYFRLELDEPDILFAASVPAASVSGNPTVAGKLRDALQRRVAQRAGVANFSVPTPGALRGYLEVCSPDQVAGWAADGDNGAARVRLAITLDGRVLAEVMADAWRPDLEQAGIGDGRHSFTIRLGKPIPQDRLNDVKVMRLADGAELPRTFELANP